MALFLTGDTHGDFRRFLPESFYEQERLTKEDLVLVCGDMGGVWYGDCRDDEGLDFLERRPFTTLFVVGNHENYDALGTYPLEDWRGGKIRRIRPSVLLLERGQVFDLNGKRIFTMGGASSHDIQGGILEPDDPLFLLKFHTLEVKGTPFRVNHRSWWKEELPSPEEDLEARRKTRRVGRWTISSRIVLLPASRMICSGKGQNRTNSRTSWRRCGSDAGSDTTSSDITMVTASSRNNSCCCTGKSCG